MNEIDILFLVFGLVCVYCLLGIYYFRNPIIEAIEETEEFVSGEILMVALVLWPVILIYCKLLYPLVHRRIK